MQQVETSTDYNHPSALLNSLQTRGDKDCLIREWLSYGNIDLLSPDYIQSIFKSLNKVMKWEIEVADMFAVSLTTRVTCNHLFSAAQECTEGYNQVDVIKRMGKYCCDKQNRAIFRQSPLSLSSFMYSIVEADFSV
jgi:hypothetical protein